MKRIVFLAVFLTLALVVAGCARPEVICNKPYIRVGTDCCLDKDDNSICDSDEVTEEKADESDAVGAAVETLSETDNTEDSEETSSDSSADTDNDDTTSDSDTEDDSDLHLQVTDVYWSTFNTKQGESVDLNIKFLNIGDKGVRDFKYIVSITKDGDSYDEVEETYTNLLPIGEEMTQELDYKFDDLGLYEATVYLKDDEEHSKSAKTTVIEGDGSSDDDNDVSGCEDTDGGLELTERGTCEDELGNQESDSCLDENALMEWYCSDDRCTVQVENCECAGGTCID
ncbi:hypothetical protein KY330_02890 [Candidatus Woesearchaeota archaeon]|nr:hypothetical protein [Candidatus Woesearchaeota archaeon]